MAVGDFVHWFIGNFCQLDCGYCQFKTLGEKEENSRLEKIADELIENRVKGITLTGNEPLVQDINSILRKLKEHNIQITLDTNGLLLNAKNISSLKGLVDVVALPIDTTNYETQRILRGEKFMLVFNRISDLASALNDADIEVGYHTVFTTLNHEDMPRLYQFLLKTNFKFWSIQYFNDQLARDTLIKTQSAYTSKQVMERWSLIESLGHNGTPQKAYTDALYGQFLLSEESMKEYNDPRIRFSRQTDRNTYFFLYNNGEVEVYLPHSTKRILMGNIFTKGFRRIKREVNQIYNSGRVIDPRDSEDFFATESDLPLWARIWEGNYFLEESNGLPGKYATKFNRLTELHMKREIEVK